MGKFYLKPGSGLLQPSAASPIVTRAMAEESKAVVHAESNLNLRIIVPNSKSFSRTVISAEDPTHCADACDPSTPPKQNGSSFDIESKQDSPCSIPESRIISPKRKAHYENGLITRKMKINLEEQACDGASGNLNPLVEVLVQQTTCKDTSSQKGYPCNQNTIDINDEPSVVDFSHESLVMDIDSEFTAGDINLESLVAATGNESTAVDEENESIADASDVDFLGFSDEESNSPPPRFDKFSRTDGPPPLPRKLFTDENLSRADAGKGGLGKLYVASHHKSTWADDELRLEASARYRLSWERKFEVTAPNLERRSQIVLGGTVTDETCSRSSLDKTEPAVNTDSIGLLGDSEILQTTPATCCRLPFNHGVDNEHYRLCNVSLAGFILRGEHTSWLNDIPSHPGIIQIVNSIIGSSCKQIILSGECTESNCTSKIDLKFDIPNESYDKIFKVFTKWFLQNTQQPNLKVILILLAHAPKNDNNVFMMVLSFAKIIVKLSNRIYRQALGIKLKEIMVRILGYKPWEAIRALLVFIVTPETEPSEILDLLIVFEVSSKSLKNRLYESLSCLWHVSEKFVCPADLLFDLLNECLVLMPVDLKLTKDRIVGDLLTLPRKILRRKFLIIEKFLKKYYPQNSKAAHLVKTSILFGNKEADSLRGWESYGTSTVKGTGPVNPQWDHWDIREAQMKGFDLVIKNSQKDKPHKETNFRREPPDLSKEKFEADVWRHDLFKIITSRNVLCYDENLSSWDFGVEKPSDSERLVDLLISGKYSHVANIISSCGDSKLFENYLLTLEREFELGGRVQTDIAAFKILKRLPGSLKDKYSVKSSFVRMLNSLIVKFYKDSNYKSALKLLALMRFSGVNHLDHKPDQVDLQSFAVICSDIYLECRLYSESIRSLQYKDCLNPLRDPNADPEQYNLLEKLVKDMFRRFLRERHASLAVDIFRIIFTAQRSLRSPLDIGKYFEGVIFLSFVSDLKKNACSAGTGAHLYVTVEKICGNSEPFRSITYRSLLVELHRAKSPEMTIRRVLRICLKKGIYPDFSRGPISPLVLDSHLAEEEMSIYLKYYFTFFIARNDLDHLTTRPLVVRFRESPRPDRKIFPVPNDIMKTPRSVVDALERFKSVLEEISHTLDADFSEDCVTISVQDVQTLIRVYSR